MAGEYIAQLPDDLKANEVFTAYPTLGDFARGHLDMLGKSKESEGKVKDLEGKIADLTGKITNEYVPKLNEKSTDADKAAFYKALGKPDKAEEYEFPTPPGGQRDERVVEWARKTFHAAHLTKEQAAHVGKEWNTFAESIALAEKEHMDKIRGEAEKKLKEEAGDDNKYKANLALADRMWKKVMGEDFTEFMKKTGFVANPYPVIKFILEVAKVTGEDFSPASQGGGAEQIAAALTYPNSPEPPKRR